MTDGDGKRLLVRKASAGSGKTYQLALNFILYTLGRRTPDGGWKLNVEGGNRHRHILAITFTNKATDEMKQRIVRELAILAGVPMMEGLESDYLPELTRRFGLTMPDDGALLRRVARSALRELLFDYAEFNVSTIDAFFQSVLRSFAFEADLSGNYEVTLDGDALVNGGIDETIKTAMESTREDSPLREWIEDYLEVELRSGKSFNLLHRDGYLRASLRDFIKSLTDEQYVRRVDEIDGFLTAGEPGGESPVKQLQQAVNRRREALAKETADLAGRLLPYADNAANKVKAAVATAIGKNAAGEIATPATLMALRENTDGAFNKGAPAPPQLFADGLTELAEKLSHLLTLDEISGQIYRLGMFEIIGENIRKIKSEANTILLSDTNSLLRLIIRSNESSPFIYERTGLKLHHFLIDEFQDTSRMQWENLRPLLLESLSRGYDNLIIGDVKQCIYRFRNSDPMLLGLELDSDAEISRHIANDPKNINYRSAREVVAFNYDLFNNLGPATGNGTVYLLEDKDTIREKAPDGYVGVCGLGDDNFRETALNRMFDEMLRQLDPEQGNYRPADIAVLVRSNEEASSIINYLIDRFKEVEKKVQVIGDESLMLSASQAVRRVIADLRRLDTLPVATSVKENGFARLSSEQLEWIASEFDNRRHADGADIDPFETLDGLIGEFDNRLASEGAESVSARPAGVESSLITIVNSLIAKLSDEMREKDSVYLYALMDQVVDFCQTGIATVHGFMEWWDRHGVKATISSAPSSSAIRVMTIHKSKGLEFSCVHVPLLEGTLGKEEKLRWYDCGEGADNLFARMGVKADAVPRYFPVRSSSGLSNTLFAKEYEDLLAASRLDELNVLYVAFTRPIRELIVSVKRVAPDKKKKTNPLNVGLLLENALGPTDNADGTWTYTLGEPTRRIENAVKDNDPDEPKPEAMPTFDAGDGVIPAVNAYISDSLFDD